MNWVDILVLGVIAISAILGFVRGLVREAMGIGAWIGAAMVAVWAGPELEPRMLAWTAMPDLSAPLAYAAAFLAALVLLSVIAGLIAGLVRGTVIGGIDNTLGVVFGLARGVLLVVVAYIVAQLLVPPGRWPDPVATARSLPYAFQGAVRLVAFLPPEYRPTIHEPPAGREARAVDLLQIPALGRATTHP